MNEQNMQRLWNNLRTRDKNFTRTYAQFKTDMQDEGNRRRLHANIQKRDSGFTRSWEEFNRDMGFGDTAAVRKEEGRQIAEEAKATPTPAQQQTQQQPAGFQMPGLFNPNSDDPNVRAMHERLKQQDIQHAKETNTVPAHLLPNKAKTGPAAQYVSPERRQKIEDEKRKRNTPAAQDITRPEDYAGDDSFYGLSTDELSAQIDALNNKREALRNQKRKEIEDRNNSFLYKLGTILNDATTATNAGGTPVSQAERDEAEISMVQLSPEEEKRYNKLVQEKIWRERVATDTYQKQGERLDELERKIRHARSREGASLDIQGAASILNKTLDLYEAPSSFGSSSGFENWKKGLADQLSDYDTWSAGVTELTRMFNLNQVANKLSRGEKLTESEDVLLEAFIEYGMMQESRQNDLAMGYTVGKGAAESIPFMAEMLISAGFGAAAKKAVIKRIYKQGNKAVANRLARFFGDEIEEAGKDIVLKEVKQNVAERVGRQVGEDVLMTAVMPTTWSSVGESRVDKVLSGKDYGFTDFMRDFTSATVETGTERWGGKAVDKVLGKVMPLDKIWGKTRWGKILTNDFIQSPFGETGEEYVGAALNYFRSYNPLYSDMSNRQLRAEARQMFSVDGFAQTFLTVLPMSALGGGANVVAAKNKINNYRSSKNEIISMLQEYGATDEEAANIILQIEGSNDTKQFTDRVQQMERVLMAEYRKGHPEATKKEMAEQFKKLDKTIGKFYQSAYYLNELSGELQEAFNKLSDEEKTKASQDFDAIIASQAQAADERIATEEERKQVEAATQEQETPAQPAQEQEPAAPAITAETVEEGRREQEKNGGKAEEPAKPQDVEMSIEVDVNGAQTPVSIKGKKVVFEEDGSIDFDKNKHIYLFDANGNPIGTEEAKAAVNDYLRQEKLNSETPAVQEAPVAEVPIEQSEGAQEIQGAPAEQVPMEEMPYPVLEDGTPDYQNMTPEQQVAYTRETIGEEAVPEMVQTEIDRLNKKLKKAENNDNLNGAQLMELKVSLRQQIAEWQKLMPAQQQQAEENAEIPQNNLVEPEKNSTFAQNSESNDKSTNRQGAGESGRDSGIQGNNDSRIPQTAVAEGANRAGSEESNGRPGQPLSTPNTDGEGPGVSGGIGNNVVSEEQEKNSLFRSLLERLGFSSTTKQPVVQVTGEYFHRVFSEAQPTIKNGWMVSVHPVESSDDEIGYNDCKCYMTADGKSGVAVAPDGDIISLWSAADKSDGTRVEKLIGWAIENGGRKCDCYANGLHGLYSMFGGRPISQTPFNEDFAPDGWDGQRGPVITFIFPETAEEALTTYANHREQGMTVRKMSEQTDISHDAVPEFTDDESGYGYDKAMRYRNQVLSGEITPEQTEEPAAEQEDQNTPINLQDNGIAILLHNVADDKLPLVKVARVTEENGQKVYREIGTDKVLSTDGGYWNEMEKQVVNQDDTDYINIKYREGQRKRLGIPAGGTAADYAALNAQNEFRPSVEKKLPNRGLTTLTKDAKSVTVGAFDNKSMDDLLETPFITGLGGIGKVFTLKDLLSLAPRLGESLEGRQIRKTIWNQVDDWCEETAIRSLKLTRGDDYSEKDVNELRNYLRNQIEHSIPQAMEMWNNIVKKYNIDELFGRTIADENGAEIPVIDLIDPRVLDAYWMLRKAIYGEKKEWLPTLIFPMKNRYKKDGWYNPPKNPEYPMGEDANIFRYMQTVVQLAVELQDVVEEIDGLEPFLNTDRNNSFPYYKTVEDARIKKGAKDIESEYKEVMKKIKDAETVKDLLSIVQHPKGWQKKNDIWFDEDGKHVADNPEYNKDYAADVEEALTIKAEEFGVRLGRLVKEETDSEGLSEEELLAQEAAMSDMEQEDGIGVESENTEESARKAAEADMKAEAEGELSQKTILLQLISEKEKEHEEAMARLEEFLLNKKDGMANDIEAINKKIENARSHKNIEQVQYLESLIDGVRTRYRDTEKKLKEKVNDVGRELAQLNDRIQFEIGGEMDTTEEGRRAAEREVEILKNAGIEVEVISEADLGSVIGEKRMQELKDSKGVVYGVSDGQQIWLIGERMNPNTPVHEYGHLFVESYAQKHPAEWKKAIELLKKTDMWQRVANDKQYANIKGNEHEIASEVFSRLLGAYYGETDMFGKTRLEDSFEQKGLVAKVTSFIRKVLREIADIFEYKLNPRSKDYNRQIRELMEKSIGELAGIETTEDTNQRFQAESESNLTAEEQKIKAEAEKNGTFMTAPNGQPTNLNEKQWLQVRTKNFINWFGDWLNDPANASKALDENGEPKIFYRGTAQPQTVLTSKYQSGAIWFTDDLEVARFYAQRRNDYQMTEEEIEANVQPVYLNMRDVAEFDSEGRRWEEAVTEPVYFIIDDDGIMVYMSRDRAEVEAYCQEHGLDPDVEIEESTTTGDVADVELMSGKDGVAFNNVIDGALKVANVRVVKDSSQAKSAVYNNGEFNPENKDIRFHVESESDLDLLTDDKEPTQPAAQMNWLQRKVNAALDQANGIRLMLKRIGEVEGRKVPANEDVRDALEAKQSKITNILNQFGMHQRRHLKKALRQIQKTMKKNGLWKKGMTDYYVNSKGVRSERKLTLINVLDMYLSAKDTIERISQERNVRDIELPFRILQYLGMPTDTPLETQEQRVEVMQKMVDTFEEKVGKEQIDALWEGINECTNFTLDVLLNGGVIGQSLCDELKKSKFYVPERGFAQLETNEDVRHEVNGRKTSTRRKLSPEATKKAKGGESMATDIIANILYIATDAVACAEENKVRHAAFDLMKNHTEACKQLGYPVPEKVWYVRNGFNEDGSPRYEAQVEKPSDEIIQKNEEVLELIREYREDLEMFEDNPAMQAEIKKRIEDAKKELLIVQRKDAGGAALSRATLAGEEMPKVLVSVPTEDGDIQQYTMVFPNQPEIANALNGVIDAKFSDTLMKTIGHRFSSLFTTYDPLFWSRNLPRDVLFVLQKGTAERGVGYGPFFAVEMARPATTILPIIEYVMKLDVYDRAKGGALSEEGPIERDFRRFLEGGGNTGFTQMKDIQQFRTEADRIVNGENPVGATLGFIFGDVPAALNEFSELWTRFAVYRATKAFLAAENRAIRTIGRGVGDMRRMTEYTEDEIEAMALHDSRNFSTNFNRRGAGAFIDFFNSISMFANASIQGASGVWRTFEQGEWQKGIRGAAALMVVPALLGYILTMLTPDDDDKEKKIPDYIRQNNLVFIDKRIPLPYDLAPWYRIGVNYALMKQGRISKTDGIENIAMGFAEHSLPVSPAIANSLKTAIDVFVPETDFNNDNPKFYNAILPLLYGEFATPWQQLEKGENWTGSKLRYEYAKDNPQWMYQDYEAEPWKAISKGFYKYLGKGDMENPSITVNGKKMNNLENISPKEVKSIVGSVSPGGWVKITCWAWGLEKGNVREQDIPFKSDFNLVDNPDMARIGISAEMSAMIREAKENYTRIPGLMGMDERDAEQRIKLWDKTHKDYTQVRLKKDELKPKELSKYKNRLERGYGIKIDGDSAEDLLHAYIIVMTSEQCEMKGLKRTIGDMERWKSKYKDTDAIRRRRYGR